MTIQLVAAMAGLFAAGQAASAPPASGGSWPGARGRRALASPGDTFAPVSAPFQLRSSRTGVTCSTLIVPADPDVDPGIFASRPDTPSREEGPRDPMVRSRISACVD